MKHYLLIVWGDVDPELKGPYKNASERDQAAKDHRASDDDTEDGLYRVDVNSSGKPKISSYPGFFFDN